MNNHLHPAGIRVPGIADEGSCGRHDATEWTFDRWRNEFGGMNVADARRRRGWHDALEALPGEAYRDARHAPTQD